MQIIFAFVVLVTIITKSLKHKESIPAWMGSFFLLGDIRNDFSFRKTLGK